MFDFELITEDMMNLDTEYTGYVEYVLENEELSNIISEFSNENIQITINELSAIKQIYLGIDYYVKITNGSSKNENVLCNMFINVKVCKLEDVDIISDDIKTFINYIITNEEYKKKIIIDNVIKDVSKKYFKDEH